LATNPSFARIGRSSSGHPLDQEIAAKKPTLSTLTENIKKLTYAQVGRNNAVFRLRASTKPVHEANSAGDPLYVFSGYVQGADDMTK